MQTSSSKPTSRAVLDDLEITGELPVGYRLARLALLPFAGRGIMVDELGAEQNASGLRAAQPLRRVPQGRGQRPLGRGRELIGVAGDRLVRIHALLYPPQAGADRGGERHIG